MILFFRKVRTMSEDSEQDLNLHLSFILTTPDEQSSSEEPRSDWSSLELVPIQKENKKKVLYDAGLYSAGSGEICAKAITMSHSSMFKHKYYKYPSVTDPGIKDALFLPEYPVNLPDDGQALYLQLCEEMNLCPVRMFHKNLLSTEINLKYYGVNQRGVSAMAQALQYNKYVSRFDLTSNFLNDDACYHLGHMLGINNTLKELILDGCRIGASGMLRLGNELRLNHSLEYLSIGDNNLGDAGALHFIKQISNPITNVKRVNLTKNQLSKETALAFQDLWEWKNNFIQLDLSWNNFFHVPTTCKMLNQLALSLSLRELNLSFNSLQGQHVASAIKNVLFIPTLEALDLSNNKLQSEAIEIIISELFSASELKLFDLSNNPLTPQDAYNVLKKMLYREIKIKSLLMKSICVTKPFIKLLARVKRMKGRTEFVCEFDAVLQNWTVVGPDARETLLRRAQYLGGSAQPKKDMAKYFMALTKKYTRPVRIKDFIERLDNDHVPLDEDFIDELSLAFEGPTTPKSRTVDLTLISDFILRLWPDKKLPPTPPAEPEPEQEPVVVLPAPSPSEGKIKRKVKK